MQAYEYQHIVGCEHLPDIAEGLKGDLRLVTTRCSCEYLSELVAFDRVIIRMRLDDLTQNGISLSFEYLCRKGEGLELVARGEQKIVCMQRGQDQIRPTPIPKPLRQALQCYA